MPQVDLFATDADYQPEIRRLTIDRLASRVLGYMSQESHYLQPEDYKSLLIETLFRLTRCLDFIGGSEAMITTAPAPLMEEVR